MNRKRKFGGNATTHVWIRKITGNKIRKGNQGLKKVTKWRQRQRKHIPLKSLVEQGNKDFYMMGQNCTNLQKQKDSVKNKVVKPPLTCRKEERGTQWKETSWFCPADLPVKNLWFSNIWCWNLRQFVVKIKRLRRDDAWVQETQSSLEGSFFFFSESEGKNEKIDLEL